MSKNNDSFFNINVPLTIICLVLPIAAGYYLAALLSTSEPNSIETLLQRGNIIVNNPLGWYFNKLTIPMILFSLVVYGVTVIVIGCMHKPTRYGEEHGSSHFISPFQVSKELADNHNSIEDPMNIVVYKYKKLRFFKSLIYKWKYRKAD
jgi:hypothetical protein